MKNAEWCIKNNIRFKNLCFGPSLLGPQEDQIGYYDGTTITFHELYRGKRLGRSAAEGILIWLDMEHDEEVLDSTEKLYLASIIKPFRRRVRFIMKTSNGYGLKYRGIVIGFADPNDDIYLPRFRADTMYKGMQLYRKYKLEELGL